MGDAMRRHTDLADVARKDADEIRRLLYMALLVGRTKKYNLAGTLINALRHHQGVKEPGLESKIIRLVNAEADEGSEADEKWARGLIAALTAKLSE
jgi:hypothetical protein